MTAANITTVVRRTFGLLREIHICRCCMCRWRAECRELGTAVALSRSHTCREEGAA